ncbi:MAG: hypothetical protein Fur002_07610 [Anaerolineales bacterium]
MSLSQALDVAVGLMFVYYLLGTIISLITQLINETFETRGAALQQYLLRLFGDKKLGDFFRLPQVQALRPIRYKNLMSVFSSATEPKKLEKVPASIVVDALFDLSGFANSAEMSYQELLDAVDKMPDSESKRAFVQWINQGVTNLSDLRARASAYINGLLEQAADTFRARARSFVIILSLFVTLLFGTDSIQLAQNLWNSADLRAIAAAQAQVVVEQQGARADVTDIVDELGKYSIKIGWWQTQQLPDPGSPAMDWVTFVLMKGLGLSITAIAVSQGSSFWYDLLKKLTKTEKILPDAKG